MDSNLIDESPSVIINLAAEHRDNVTPHSLYYETNVQGASNICEIARDKFLKLTSSLAQLLYIDLQW